MSQTCASNCSCCVQGQCKSIIECSSTSKTLLIIGSVVGAITLIFLVVFVAIKCWKWRKQRRISQVGIQPNSSGRNRVNGVSGSRSPNNRNILSSGVINRDEEQASPGPIKIVRAFPDKDIPTTVPFSDLPLTSFVISKVEPIIVIVGDKPAGKPKFLTDSIKSLTMSKGKLDNFKGVIVKQNTNHRSTGKGAKRVIIEEIDQNDVSNMSLVESIEKDSKPYDPARD